MESNTLFRRRATDICIALTPLFLMGIFYYGFRVVVITFLSVLTAVLSDHLCLLMQGNKHFKIDLSSIVEGYVFAMMLPASAPYWLVIIGSAFTILVVKYPFGGHYNTMFNPAVTAFAFITICWTDIVTKYPVPRTILPLNPNLENIALNHSPAYRLMNGGAENIGFLNALIGNFYGPLGATCLIVLFSSLAFLIIRKTAIWQIPVGVFSVIAFFALIFPRVNANRFTSLVLELCSGILVFSVTFIASIDNEEIKTDNGKWFYGVSLGLFIVLFRNISQIELVCPFALIVMSTIDHKCDSYAESFFYYSKEFCENAWLIIKWICGYIFAFFSFLWDKLFSLIQKIIDK